MSPEKRFYSFKAHIVAKSLLPVQEGSLTALYQRVILTRRLLELSFSILLIFGGQLFVIQNAFFCPVWSGTGVALSAVFLRGNFLLLGIFLGSFSSYLHNHFSWSMSFFQSGLFVVYIYLIRQICLTRIGPITPFANTLVLWKFLAVCALLTALDVSIIYSAFSVTNTLNTSFIDFFLVTFSGQLNGILCITPLCLIFEPFLPERYFQKINWGMWTLVVFIIGCQFLYYFFPCLQSLILTLFITIFFFIFGKKYGQFPTCVALLGISVIYLGTTSSTYTLFQKNCPPSLILFSLTFVSIVALYSATIFQEKIFRSITSCLRLQ